MQKNNKTGLPSYVNSNCFMNETETNIRDNYQRLPSMLISSLSLRPFFFLCPKAYSFPRQCKFPLQNFPKPIFNDHRAMLNSKLLGYTHSSCAEKFDFFFSFSLYSYCVKIWVLRLSVILHWAMPTAMTKGKQMELISCTSWKGVGFVWIPRPNFGF